MLFITSTFNWIHVFFWLLSTIGYVLVLYLYSAFPEAAPQFFHVAQNIWSMAITWFILILTSVACIMIDLAIEHVRSAFSPTPEQIIMEQENLPIKHTATINGHSGYGTTKAQSLYNRVYRSSSTPNFSTNYSAVQRNKTTGTISLDPLNTPLLQEE